MTRDSQLPGPDLEPDDEQEPQGRLRATGPGLVAGLLLVGLVLGRVVRPGVEELGGIPPRVGWLSVLVLFFVAAVMGFVAWSTHRTIQQRGARLEPQQAVNRLVLAKAGAIAGSFLAGGYLGYLISWLDGGGAALAGERRLHSALAAVASAVTVAGSLALERACRVRNGDRQP